MTATRLRSRSASVGWVWGPAQTVAMPSGAQGERRLVARRGLLHRCRRLHGRRLVCGHSGSDPRGCSLPRAAGSGASGGRSRTAHRRGGAAERHAQLRRLHGPRNLRGGRGLRRRRQQPGGSPAESERRWLDGGGAGRAAWQRARHPGGHAQLRRLHRGPATAPPWVSTRTATRPSRAC